MSPPVKPAWRPRRRYVPPASPTCIWRDRNARVIDRRQVVDHIVIDFDGYPTSGEKYSLKMRWQDHSPPMGADTSYRVSLHEEATIHRRTWETAYGVHSTRVTKCCLCGMVYLEYGKQGSETRDENRVVRE